MVIADVAPDDIRRYLVTHGASKIAVFPKLTAPQLLFDLWMLQNPRYDDDAENVAAINASIDDFMNGERGTPAGEHSKQLRQEFGFTDE